jgi:hypothetical protein
MDPDLALVIGLVLGVFAIPSIVSAITDARAPRVAAFTIVVSGGLLVWAIANKPGGYSINDIPGTVLSVVARYLT